MHIISLFFTVAVVMGVTFQDSREVLVPKVATHTELAYVERTRISGPFTHTMSSSPTIDVAAVNANSISFHVSTDVEGHHSERSFLLDTNSFALSSDTPVGVAIAPFSYTSDLFGTPPNNFSVGTTWQQRLNRSVLGNDGVVKVRVTTLDIKNDDCTLALEFRGSGPVAFSTRGGILSGVDTRQSTGFARFHRGILVELHMKGVDRQRLAGQPAFDQNFEVVKTLQRAG